MFSVSLYFILAVSQMLAWFGSVRSTVTPQTYHAVPCLCVGVHVTPVDKDAPALVSANITCSESLQSGLGALSALLHCTCGIPLPHSMYVSI